MGDADQMLDPLRRDPAGAALLFDIDGTLAPITAVPDAASVPAATREVLAELARRYRLVACVSGRRALWARTMVGLDELTYAGNHGLELLEPGAAEPADHPALAGRAGAAAALIERLDRVRLEGLGLRFEDKGPIQAVHWRMAPDQAAAQAGARELARRAESEGLVAHCGRRVLEIRPLAEVHKGVATRRLIETAGVRAALFGGDDRTDLDAFAALRELGESGALATAVCVGVASAEGPPEIQREADLVVDGTEGFLGLLRGL